MADTRPQNTVFILSDEHNRNIAGCYGHPFIRTPNIDRLASRGTRFDAAYCNSPICVPARAALATGRYVHRIGCWDNAMPYHGQYRSWHHEIRDSGREVVSIGKLHFRSSDDDNGFSREILPMHILGGKGDLKGLLRKDPPPKKGADDMAMLAGVGVSDYFAFDKKVADTAAEWVSEMAGRETPPWALFVSFVMPHFPLIAPEEYYSLYEKYNLDELRHGLNAPVPNHPVLVELRNSFDYDSHFDDASRAVALRAYYGMVTALDANIGNVLKAIEDSGQNSNTRVIYASDHGDNLGNRGMWGKSVHYDDSAAIPLIAVGDGFPVGTEKTPVSLVDIFPTMVQSTGAADPEVFSGIDGKSLFDIVKSPNPDRVVFSEYHAVYSRAGHFMIRRGDWKLVYYLDGPPQLFNLTADPEERDDLADKPEFAAKRAELETELHKIADPEKVSAQAFADQDALVEASGGEEAILGTADIPHTPVPSD
jgi:choline-sulfatase